MSVNLKLSHSPEKPPHRGIWHFQFSVCQIPIPQGKNSAPNLRVILGEQMPLPLFSYSRSFGYTNKPNTRGMPEGRRGGGHVEVYLVKVSCSLHFFFLFCMIYFSYLCLWSCHNRLWTQSLMHLDQSRIHHPPLSPHFVVCLYTSDLGPSLWHLSLLKLIHQ